MSGWIAWIAASHAGVVINELLPDPAGADGGHEWVELHNTGPGPVDLSGWRLEKATSGAFSLEFTFPPGALLPAGGYAVVGEALVPGATWTLAEGDVLALGNAGNNGDAVRLVDTTLAVVDTVIYGPNNDDGFVDDDDLIASEPAPRPVSGASLARVPNGQDSNISGLDFAVVVVPTPGATNDAAPCGPGPGVVINELIPNPNGPDDGFEWVELYNPGSQTIDLSGWSIASGTANYTAIGTLPPGVAIPSGAFVLVAQSNAVPGAVVAPGFSLGNATSNADAVQLRDSAGCPMDTVVYGPENTDGWMDDAGREATSLAPMPGSGMSLARVADGLDTDDCGVDFAIAQPTPGSSNTTAPADCGGRGSGLVVNELLTNPAGPDDGFEWIELYHAGFAPLDLGGWAVQSATSAGSWGVRHSFAPGTWVQPGQFLLVGGAQVPGITHPLAGSLGNGTNGDGVRVVDCAGIPSDTVIYGGTNDDGLVDDTGEVARSIAPTPPEGGAIQRLQDGLDTDQSGLDFAVAATITPGGPNPVLEPLVCAPTTGAMRINEVLPDPDGADAGLEWVELYNAGAEPVRLDGWAISAGTSHFDRLDAILPGGTWIEPGAFFVIGGELVPEADFVARFTLGNGTSSPDGVRLYDCLGQAVDTVIYGVPEAEPPAEPTGIVDDNDLPADPYGDPGAGQSLFRIEDGVDTDTAEDWKAGRPTPGASNMVLYSSSDGTAAPGCGRGKAPGAAAPQGGPGGSPPTSGGCATAPAPPLGLAALALLLGWRRRAYGPVP